MIMGDSFEIRGKAYEGRLGPTLTVGPIIRLIFMYYASSRFKYRAIISGYISPSINPERLINLPVS